MNYEQYLQSAQWRSLRQQVLKRDGNCCQTCLSAKDLEVHHKTYERLGHEEMADLITLCHECHEAITCVIRRRRYVATEITVETVQRFTPLITKRGLADGEIEVSTHVRITPSAAQWATSRSAEQILKGVEEGQQQERKDGRRF